MSDTMPPTPEDGREARTDAIRRLAAMRKDPTGAAPADIAQVITPSLHSGRRRLVVALGILVALATIAGVGGRLFLLGVSSHPGSPAAPVSIAPRANGMVCLRDIAWSPNGDNIAAIGYDNAAGALTCPASMGPTMGSYPGLLSIYRVRDGKLAEQFHPDTAIRSQITVPAVVHAYLVANMAHPDDVATYTIDYTHVLWSADEKRLYVTFLLAVPQQPPHDLTSMSGWPSAYFSGVEVISYQGGGEPRVALKSLGATPDGAVEWDLSTLDTLPIAIGQTGEAARFTSVTPALNYAWRQDGALATEQPLPTAARASTPPTPATGAVGNPNGGASFSLWQPGMLSSTLVSDADGTTLVSGTTLTEDIAALSPDGRYLIENIHVQGLVITDSSQIRQMGAFPAQNLGGVPLLSVRDKAILPLVALEQRNPFQAQYALSRSLTPIPLTGIYVAWRQDGRYVAAMANDTGYTVHIFDSHTGKEVAKFAQQTSLAGQDGNIAPRILRWSADGARLLVFDPGIGMLTIWTPSLPSHP